MGDWLILEAARRLSRCLRQDTLERLGGDEFTVLRDDIREDGDAFRVAGRQQAALQQPFMLEGHEVVTSASIGVVASRRTDGADTVDALRNADAAMYRARSSGVARAELFDTTMRAGHGAPAAGGGAATRAGAPAATRHAASSRRESSSPSPRSPG